MDFISDSHRIQTCNLLIRSQMLYSVELANQAQHLSFCECKVTNLFPFRKIFRQLFLSRFPASDKAPLIKY